MCLLPPHLVPYPTTRAVRSFPFKPFSPYIYHIPRCFSTQKPCRIVVSAHGRMSGTTRRGGVKVLRPIGPARLPSLRLFSGIALIDGRPAELCFRRPRVGRSHPEDSLCRVGHLEPFIHSETYHPCNLTARYHQWHSPTLVAWHLCVHKKILELLAPSHAKRDEPIAPLPEPDDQLPPGAVCIQ